jgi:hypothetical protein
VNAGSASGRYEHTQRSVPILLLFCLAGVVGALMALLLPGTRALPLGPRLVIAASALAMFGSGVVFSSLTTRIADGRLAWHFGPGLMQKAVPLAEVASAVPARTTWVDGWGIHLTGRGWLYNVAGRQAVLVTMVDGKRFMLGTDEPDALAQAIRGR